MPAVTTMRICRSEACANPGRPCGRGLHSRGPAAVDGCPQRGDGPVLQPDSDGPVEWSRRRRRRTLPPPKTWRGRRSAVPPLCAFAVNVMAVGASVDYAVRDGVAVLSVTNPPVNALSSRVFADLAAAVQRANADPAVRAIVICGAGSTFPAGADISEFPALVKGTNTYENGQTWA